MRTDRMNLIVAFRNFANATKKEGGKQKIKRSMRWLVDRKKREVANLLIELQSNKLYDFQNYRRTDSQLFQNSLLLIRSIRGKCCNDVATADGRISVTPRHLVTGNKMT